MVTTHTKNSIVQTLKSHKEQLKAFGEEKIGLFGSYIRNEATINSDIDLLVNIRKEKKTFRNFMSLIILKMYLIVKWSW